MKKFCVSPQTYYIDSHPCHNKPELNMRYTAIGFGMGDKFKFTDCK